MVETMHPSANVVRLRGNAIICRSASNVSEAPSQ